MSTAPHDRRSAGLTDAVRLGLIGDNIKRSRSPDLHRLAGRLSGLDVSYDLFIPREMGKDFDAVFDACRDDGLRGVNVTYPYKEIVASRLLIHDDLTRRIGSVNTVVFGPRGSSGYNTDHTGFIAAYREAFGDMAPGSVGLIGAGGVGKAVAFGLLALGAEALTVVDSDAEKAHSLAAAIATASKGAVATSSRVDVDAAIGGAEGIVNCTPLGMHGHPGSPVRPQLLGKQRWAFDAVYTPVDTIFKQQAEAAGVKVLSGFELFFHQGIEAFRIFTGRAPADLSSLRRMLLEIPPTN
ncbi:MULTISPECIES: shikimate dehydrogenase family protein [unclassified Mesorhizobium]|uniref:shikimate dehydrogenase family protein n=1 Tax=unclassified Mesorhizobium TaxID=325217 RepID=UPI001CC952C3|nr:MULTISPECIES: NAD(P)-binding domain-containing protein [unclassified Mesorhizobium]MBZ9739859.1 shikimate dehydrogenase [Mesorhizobium sp. CO1-1-4]MBZ9805670.1 shikimate dehydrogenase [Mesorhizobium sp. ES1-6]